MAEPGIERGKLIGLRFCSFGFELAFVLQGQELSRVTGKNKSMRLSRHTYGSAMLIAC
jgi:hypothetical protein